MVCSICLCLLAFCFSLFFYSFYVGSPGGHLMGKTRSHCFT